MQQGRTSHTLQHSARASRTSHTPPTSQTSALPNSPNPHTSKAVRLHSLTYLLRCRQHADLASAIRVEHDRDVLIGLEHARAAFEPLADGFTEHRVRLRPDHDVPRLHAVFLHLPDSLVDHPHDLVAVGFVFNDRHSIIIM